ncbi:unnamed protein product, partial [Notodromas monacha]
MCKACSSSFRMWRFFLLFSVCRGFDHGHEHQASFSPSENEILSHYGPNVKISDLSPREQAMAYFNVFDTDKNGALDGVEILQTLFHEHVHELLGADGPDMDHLRRVVHSDEDLAEFVDDTLEQYDANFDGMVQLAELTGMLGPAASVLKADGEDQAVVTGSSGVACAWGLNHYLKHFCGTHLSWNFGVENVFEGDLPPVDILINISPRYRYYANVVTHSYSFLWWKWKEWEKHIDWLALNGINLPLATTAYEYTLNEVLKSFGASEETMKDFFSGPAFLAWFRMGNMKTWGGPNGLITEFLVFLNNPLYLLDPGSVLYSEISQAFVKQLIADFGTDHLYSCDLFNENGIPGGVDPVQYLNTVGKGVYNSLAAVDPDAI